MALALARLSTEKRDDRLSPRAGTRRPFGPAERLLLGNGIQFDLGVIVWLGESGGYHLPGERVFVGRYSDLGTSTHKLEIGEDTMIRAQCYIITANHCTERRTFGMRGKGFDGAHVQIGKTSGSAAMWPSCRG